MSHEIRKTNNASTNSASKRKSNKDMPPGPGTDGSSDIAKIISELTQIRLEIHSLKENQNELKKEIDELKKEVLDLKRVKQKVADEINKLKTHKTETMQQLDNMEYRLDSHQRLINESIEPVEKTMYHEYQKYLILCPVITSLKEIALEAIESDHWEYCFDLLDRNLLGNSQAKAQLHDITADYNILEEAARKGHTELVAVFIKNGFPIDSPCGEDGGTLLHYAVVEKEFALMDFLLSQGAFVDSKDKYGRTPLYWTSCGNYNATIIDELISWDADANICCGSTPLHNACKNGNYEAVQILLDNEVKVDVQTSEEWRTPLHEAAEYGDERIVRLLLEHEAYVDKRTKYCETPLHLAAEKGHMSVVKTLVNYKCNVHAKTCDGWTALNFAEENDHSSVAAFLNSEMS